jgi:3',5'-cyclic-AMP phosphodiesterase
MRRVRTGVVALAVLAGACSLRPAEERALKDLLVGLVEGKGTRVTVEEGLAAVRRMEAGVLTLWGSAPGFHVRVGVAAGGPEWWTVEVRNAMSDAELTAVVGGEALEVEAGPPGLLPTVKRWRVRLRPGVEARLTVAPPGWEERGPFRFAALADVQEALPRVEDIYARINEDPSVRFIFFSGDLTRRGDVEELEEFQRRLEASHVPMFATLGNHEIITSDVRWHEYFGRGNLHFTFQGAHFTFLDSGNGTVDPLVEEALDGWLDAGRESVHILGTHIPLLDPIGVRGGAFASRNEAASLLGRLARGRVDLTLYGHVHSYYAFANVGIPAYISGGGGAIPELFDGVGRHYLAVDVDPAGGEVRKVSLVRVD